MYPKALYFIKYFVQYVNRILKTSKVPVGNAWEFPLIAISWKRKEFLKQEKMQWHVAMLAIDDFKNELCFVTL